MEGLAWLLDETAILDTPSGMTKLYRVWQRNQGKNGGRVGPDKNPIGSDLFRQLVVYVIFGKEVVKADQDMKTFSFMQINFDQIAFIAAKVRRYALL